MGTTVQTLPEDAGSTAHVIACSHATSSGRDRPPPATTLCLPDTLAPEDLLRGPLHLLKEQPLRGNPAPWWREAQPRCVWSHRAARRGQACSPGTGGHSVFLPQERGADADGTQRLRVAIRFMETRCPGQRVPLPGVRTHGQVLRKDSF